MQSSETMISKLRMLGSLCLLLLAINLVACRTVGNINQAPSWTDQMKQAQHLAQQIAPDAVLFEGIANPVDDINRGSSKTLSVSLEFIRPSGELITVLYDDTNITKTLRIAPSTGQFTPSLSSERLSQLSKDVSIIQVSPAQALAKTSLEGRAFAEQYGMKREPLVGLFTDVKDELGVPVAWSVQYFAPSKEIRIWVNAQTGEIIGRTDGSMFPN